MQFSLISALAALFFVSTLAAPVLQTRDIIDDACNGKAIGDACSFSTPEIGTITGTCANPSDDGVIVSPEVFCAETFF
ncbi:hypothetical protein B0H10DRAFT_2224106 [Mycena sp. CBHHK59/15]|nr:hypothetical protein B0H10DRAFT_2234209 [Mycena sp. CBHHK59/15]KAJ6611332.1 hypothetical protein B0H10DRAFT_2224106 [Mycena sp. CBHHK59/15]KAJ7121687.1 hypothetical protein C8R44DRAFT_786683 [Mycena epipterygia]